MFMCLFTVNKKIEILFKDIVESIQFPITKSSQEYVCLKQQQYSYCG